MKRKSLFLPALSGLLLSAALLAPAAYADEETVTILHTNDIHGRIEEGRDVIGMAKLATAVEDARQEGTTLVLDAGDAFQGLPISNSTKGEDMAELMNAIGYDAMAVGNHEFDFSLEQAEKYKQLLNFPLLSANTYVNDARLFEASTIIDKTPDVAGDEFVVIGVTTPETSTKTHPNNVNGVEFRDPITEVTNVITEIEARQSYNNYIILAHLGIDSTTPVAWQGSSLAEALAANEVLRNKRVIVIDGHSHTVSQNRYGSNVTYTQTGSYLNNIGKLTLSQSGVEAGLITTQAGKALTANPAIAEKVAEIKAKYDAENAVVVLDNSPIEFNGERDNVRVRETNLGNLVADALWDYGQTGFSHKTDLAVTNGGGLRATIAKDQPITKGDIIAVLPFGNIISQIEVTGQQIKDMFTKSLGSILQTRDGQPVLDDNGNPLLEASGGFLHVSGARVVYDPRLAPEHRVLSVQIYNPETEKADDLDLERTYYLATNDFLAAGGDGYTMLGGAREEGPSMDSVLADFLPDIDPHHASYATINPSTRLLSVNSELDSDGDGFLDYKEQLAGTDAHDPASHPEVPTIADIVAAAPQPQFGTLRPTYETPELSEQERRRKMAEDVDIAKRHFERLLGEWLASYGRVDMNLTYQEEAGELIVRGDLVFEDGSHAHVADRLLYLPSTVDGIFELLADRSVAIDPSKAGLEDSYSFYFVDSAGAYNQHRVYKGPDGRWTSASLALVVDPISGKAHIPAAAIHPRSQGIVSPHGNLVLPARHNYLYAEPTLTAEIVADPTHLTAQERARLRTKLLAYAAEHYRLGTSVTVLENGRANILFPDGSEHVIRLALVRAQTAPISEKQEEIVRPETTQQLADHQSTRPTPRVQAVADAPSSRQAQAPATLGLTSSSAVVAHASHSSSSDSLTRSSETARELPKTGDASTILSALGLVSLLGGLGLGRQRREN